MENLNMNQIIKRIAQREARFYEKIYRPSVKEAALELLYKFEELLDSRKMNVKQQKVVLITIYQGLLDYTLEYLLEVNQY